MSECSVFAEFSDEVKTKEALGRLQPEGLSELRQRNRFFYFVEGGQPNENPRVVEVKMSYFVSWAIPEIAAELQPIQLTANMKAIWKRPTTGAVA